jgi:hypothetical protein
VVSQVPYDISGCPPSDEQGRVRPRITYTFSAGNLELYGHLGAIELLRLRYGKISQGRDHPIDEPIAKARVELTLIEEMMRELTSKAKRKQKAQWTTFVLGLVALVIARRYGPVLGIICELGK